MKKFLSLVLALIMTMSLVTIGAGATEYRDLTDKDEIQYEEAVAVLNRIGVITGYDDGSFQPTRELTRGAAAKIIVSLLIGPEAASNLPNATAPYPDVPASHTFAGVISYCKTAGIISGYGDGTFKPGNSLTGFAFAKMLLGALGYKSEIEGFVDTGWTMNVAKVANVTGLLDRLEFDGAAAVNREEACQLALNTLKATMVTYGGTTLVSGAQNLAVANTQAIYVTSNNREINANINRRVISAANNEMTLEFGEEHFKDLRLEHDKYDPAYDDFGHPSNEWSYKKVTIGTFKLPADFTYTTQVAYREDSAATKEKALGLRGYDTYSTDHRASSANWSTASSLAGLNGFGNWNSPFADATQITINGWNSRIWDASYTQTSTPALSELDKKAFQDGTQYSYDAGAITAATKDQAPSLSEIADLTDNGVTVEVYVCPVDADFITNVVVTRTQLMKVDRIGSDYVSLERISPDSRDPRRTPSDGLAKITGYNAFSVDVDVVDVKDSNYDPYNALKDLKAGDRVAVVPFTPDEGKTWEAGEVYVPETVSGRLADVGLYMNTSKRDGNAVSITIGGTKYVINEWNLDMLDVKKPQIDATRKDVTGYLAKDGTVLWTTEIGNSDAWMVVGDYYQATNSSGKVVWFAHGWTIGGEEVDIDLGTIRNQAEKYAPGELVHYDISNGTTGEYVLSKPNASRNSLRYSDGAQAFGEPGTANEKTGEGVYNVAQYVKTNSNSNSAFEIHPSNSLIPLERYKGTDITSAEHTAAGGAIFASEKDASGKPDPAKPHTWNYRSTTYKDTGVKFIYVSFSPVTGEVDYISVRNGVQNVKNEELTYQNTIWNNTATHNVVDTARTWVISPAEAYVNDKGHVEAVVIKSEPTVADLSNVVIVGKVVGTEVGKNTGAEEVSALTNVRTREYWQGPDFSEKKTGSFKNQHNTGDVLVIRSTDTNGVMDCKTFNSGVYGNRNPDVIWAKDIVKLTSAAGDPAKIAFYIGRGTGFVWDQARNDISVKSSADKTVDNMIMTERQTEGDQLWDLTEFKNQDYKGLVKVTGSTKWLDLREEEWGHDVRNLSDLYDLDLTTVEIKVLLNGNETSDAFRSAYAVVVLAGKPSSDAPGTTASGNITLDSASSKLLGSVNNSYGTLALNRLSGDIVANIKVSAPDWAVDANTSVTYDLEVKANGKSVGTMTNKVANKAADGTFTDTPFISVLNALNSKLISVDDTFTGVIKNVRWANSGVKYVYEGGKDASAALTAGYTDKLSNTVAGTLGFTYTMPTTTHQQKDVAAGTTYSITGATPAQTKISYTNSSPVTTAAVKANNGWVTVTINNVVEKAPAQTFTVKAESADTVLFFDNGATDPDATAPTVPANGWKTSLSAASGNWIVVKAADGNKLTALKAIGDKMATTVTPAPVGATGLFKFQMPADNVTVGAAGTSAVKVDGQKFFLKGNGTVLNVKLATGSEFDATSEAQLEELAKQLGSAYTVAVNPATGNKTLKTDLGLITTINATDNLGYVELNGKTVVSSDSTNKGLDDYLDLADITMDGAANTANIYVKVGTTAVAANDAAAVADGATIDTNGTKGYIKLAATPVTTDVTLTSHPGNIGANNETVSAALVVNSTDEFTDSGDRYVKSGATLKITLTVSANVTLNAQVKAAITVGSNSASVSDYSAATNVTALANGEVFAADTPVDLEFTLTSPTAAQIGTLSVTLSA